MKTIEIQLYKFDELSEDSQQTAIDKNRDINVDCEWWDGTYEDAKNVGIDIGSFECYRYCNATIMDTEQTAHDIMKEHGETCATYKTAATYLKERDQLIADWPQDENGDYISEDSLDIELDRLGEDFDSSIREDYRMILDREYEYLCSNEAVKESLISNEYDFTEDGNIY